MKYFPSLRYWLLMCLWMNLGTISNSVFASNNSAPMLNVLCDTIIEPELINVSVSDCGSLAAVCLPVRFEVLNTLDIFDNGSMYSGTLQGCDMDTTVAYSYNNLVGQGNLGPYFLDSWTINGNEYSGEFMDINALVDSMNVWDSLGIWEIDSMIANTISGGFSDNFYGAITANKPGVDNSTVVMGANYGLTPLGGEIMLSVGTHEIAVVDNDNNCMDTVTINVACLPNDYLSVETYVGVSGSICVDTSDLIGNFASLENTCENNMVSVDIFPNDICVDWETQAEGNGQVCLVACDDLGFCDTTFLTLTIHHPILDTIQVILSENNSEYFCIDSTELIGIVNTFQIITPPAITNLTLDTTDFCLEIESGVAGNDFACVVICDDKGGCDTTCFDIIIDNAAAGFPVANDDADTTAIDIPLILDFLANDSYAATDTISIISEPVNGTLTLDSLGNYIYTPESGVCGNDQFTYEICNLMGCDIAVVSILVACDEVQVYSGFSPNGDGVNETFVISGLETYPEHKVTVFNRWGNLVFESENYKSNWEGTWNGKRLGQGNYFYFIELKDAAKTQYAGVVYIAY